MGAYEADEDEVLFSMNTMFRIEQIKQLGDDPRLFQVELDLTTEKDDDLRLLINRIREETFPETKGWYQMGSVLRKLGEYATAQQATDESARGMIYNQLGVMTSNLGQYDGAIGYYEKSITIKEKQNPCNQLSLAMSYNNVGNVQVTLVATTCWTLD